MKNVKIFATAALLATASFATFAADLPTSQPASQPAADAQKIGVVTVSGAANLSALESELASKAAASGASSYRIVAAGGKKQTVRHRRNLQLIVGQPIDGRKKPRKGLFSFQAARALCGQ